MSNPSDIRQALDALIEATLSLTADGLLTAPFDPEWRSPCEVHQDNGLTYWRPVPQSPTVSFYGLENALEVPIHPDIQTYYQACWSGTLEADSEEGQVSLIQLWNEEDFERLIANLIGHALNKQRTRAGFTVFFANTDPDSELFLSIDNETGAILLEEPGSRPLRQVESDIGTFLRRLTPAVRKPALY